VEIVVGGEGWRYVPALDRAQIRVWPG
jgi:hypothetical protein